MNDYILDHSSIYIARIKCGISKELPKQISGTLILERKIKAFTNDLTGTVVQFFISRDYHLSMLPSLIPQKHVPSPPSWAVEAP